MFPMMDAGVSLSMSTTVLTGLAAETEDEIKKVSPQTK